MRAIQELLQFARKSEFRKSEGFDVGFDVGLLVLTYLTDRLAAPPDEFGKGLENLGFWPCSGSATVRRNSAADKVNPRSMTG